MAKVKSVKVYTFVKGEQKHLDEIYMIQGLCGGKWWKHRRPGNLLEGLPSDEIIITRNITITIIES
jgi:hypothetical protein